MIREILEYNKLYFFIFLTVVIGGLTYFIQSTFLTNEVYYNTFIEIMESERINNIIKSIKSFEIIGYLFIPMTILIKVLYNSLILSTATLLEDNSNYSLKSNFNICLKSEVVFVGMQMMKVFFIIAFKKINKLGDLNFIPFSIADLFNSNRLPKFAIYVLQTLNIWELLFCLLGSYLFASNYNLSINKATKLFCISYFFGISILVLFSVFITLLIS